MMPDYPVYMERAGIGRPSFTRCLRAKYPLFSKVQTSMVCAPEKYGVQLTREAEEHLSAVFGRFAGLSLDETVPVKLRPARTKPHRLVVYLTDETNSAVRELMERLGYRTVQEFLFDLLSQAVAVEEGPCR